MALPLPMKPGKFIAKRRMSKKQIAAHRQAASDIVLVCQNGNVECHKIVIANQCKVVQKKITDHDYSEKQMKEVSVDKFDVDIIRKIVKVIYSEEVEFGWPEIKKTVAASHFLGFTALLHECNCYLASKLFPCEMLNEAGSLNKAEIEDLQRISNPGKASVKCTSENSIVWFLFGKKYDLEMVKEYSFKLMINAFHKVTRTALFKIFDVEDVKMYLKAPNIAVSSEDDLLDAILTWVCHDCAKRKDHFATLLRLIDCNSCTLDKLNGLLKENDKLLAESNTNCTVTSAIEHLKKQTSPTESICITMDQNNMVDHKDAPNCWFRNSHSKRWYTLSSTPYGYDTWLCNSCSTLDGLIIIGGDHRNSTCMEFKTSEKKWIAYPSMPTPRYRPGVICVGNYVYAMGGCGVDFVVGKDNSMATVERLDLSKGEWEKMEDFPQAMVIPLLGEVKGVIYALNGAFNRLLPHQSKDDPNEAKMMAYDIENNNWCEKSPWPSDELPSTFYASAVTVGNKIYVAGGDCGVCAAYSTVPDTWTVLSSPALRHCKAPLLHMGGKLYLLGDKFERQKASTEVEEYAPEQDSWRLCEWELPFPNDNVLGVTLKY